MTAKPLKFNLDEKAEVGSTDYIGDMPRPREALPGRVRRVYLAETFKGEPILKVLYEVTEGKYAGYTAWDNVTLNNASAFKWKPFIAALAVTFADLATGLHVDPDDTSGAGERVTKIGKVDLTGDGVPVFFGVRYRNYEGIQQTDIAGVRPRTVVVPEHLPASKEDAPF